MKTNSEIITLYGQKPGPSLAIFAGVHGNEKVGILALQKAVPQLKLKRGSLSIAFANPPAIESNVRFVEKNLNRCFEPGNTDTSWEDNRARELMKLLDGCDALLDLHAFNELEGSPFVICEENALDLAQIFDVPLISTNWYASEPGGTDGYMYQAGKIGICLECGPLSKQEEFIDFTINSIHQFLKYYQMIDSDIAFSQTPKRIIRTERAVIRTSKNFTLDPTLQSFQKLSEGQVLGSLNDKQLVGRDGEYIIFPRPQAPIGAEAYVIGRESS